MVVLLALSKDLMALSVRSAIKIKEAWVRHAQCPIILAFIGKLGSAGATGHVIEYAGEAIRTLSMEARMMVCNMSIEAGARAGMIAPDHITIAWLKGRPYAPQGAAWDAAAALWRSLPSDADAVFDKEVALDARDIWPLM